MELDGPIISKFYITFLKSLESSGLFFTKWIQNLCIFYTYLAY